MQDSAALRSVATAFLRRRPVVVAPMFIALIAALAWSGARRGQLLAVATFATVAMAFFGWEAWRGRSRWVSPGGLYASLVVTLLGIGVASAATGGATSPVLLMAFAPTVVGFAAFGRGARSNTLLALAVGLLGALALFPAAMPPLADDARRAMIVVCGAASLLLLRLGVTALADAHALARQAASRAGEDVVGAAEARAASLEAMGAKVAHEVKNPLAAIRALVEVLAEKPQEARDAQRLGVVLTEVARIDDILRGYLALARPLDQIDPRPHDVAGLLGEVAAILEARLERAGLTLVLDAAPVTLAVDPRRLKEALLNLALNAIEATPRGGTIRLACAPSEHGARIRVEDSGAGMSPGRLAAAGTPFATGRADGTGLGLALARQAIEQHGGTLVLESREGKGTLALVTLVSS